MKTQYLGRRSVHPGWVYQPRGLEWSIGKDEKGWGYINFYYVGTSWMSFISMVSTGPKWMLVVDKRSFYKRVCRGSFECSWKRFKRRQVVKWSFGRLTLAGKPANDTKQTLAKESRFFFSWEGLTTRQAGLCTFPGQKGEMKRRSIGKVTKVISDFVS